MITNTQCLIIKIVTVQVLGETISHVDCEDQTLLDQIRGKSMGDIVNYITQVGWELVCNVPGPMVESRFLYCKRLVGQA